MARKLILENLMKLASGIGANPQKFMGTRTNITFLGKGPQKNPLFQRYLPGLESATTQSLGSRSSLIEATEDAMGFASAGKLNDIQLKILTENLSGINKILNPPTLPTASITTLSRSGLKPRREWANPERGSGIASLETEGVAELPQKTHSARATMIRLLDVHAGGQPGVGVTLREIMSHKNPNDLKWLLEGGGGAEGDPIALFAKYFGPVAARNLPTRGTPEVIEEFSRKLMRMKDSMGRKIDDPFFNPDDIGFAGGGLAKILEVNDQVNRYDLM